MLIGAVNFSKPYRGKCGVILWNYWRKEFEKRKTKLNKLKGFGLNWMIARSGGTNVQLIPKSTNIFDFYII